MWGIAAIFILLFLATFVFEAVVSEVGDAPSRPNALKTRSFWVWVTLVAISIAYIVCVLTGVAA